MFDGTVSFDKDFMAFATPNPQPMPKWMALMMPFHFYVWICVVGSVIVSRGAVFLTTLHCSFFISYNDLLTYSRGRKFTITKLKSRALYFSQ